MLKNLQIITSY
jgi:hypothetical protein